MSSPFVGKTKKGTALMIEPCSPNENPRRRIASATMQVMIAAVCALVVAQGAGWETAVHVFLAVLTLFTSVNRAVLPRQQCARCGHLQ